MLRGPTPLSWHTPPPPLVCLWIWRAKLNFSLLNRGTTSTWPALTVVPHSHLETREAASAGNASVNPTGETSAEASHKLSLFKTSLSYGRTSPSNHDASCPTGCVCVCRHWLKLFLECVQTVFVSFIQHVPISVSSRLCHDILPAAPTDVGSSVMYNDATHVLNIKPDVHSDL